MCYFSKLGPIIKTNLLYSYCSSLYGCELWDQCSPQLSAIGVSWRKGLKRLWNLPYNTHGHILYAVCGKWPIEDEMCRRSLRFAVSCLNSNCAVVSYVVRFSLLQRPAQSVTVRNILHCCQLYKLEMGNLLNMSMSTINSLTGKINFRKLCCNNISSAALSTEHLNLLLECIFVRDGIFNVYHDSDDHQLHDIMRDIILFICTN